MKILHTSDWHLGRIFHGVHLTEDQSYILDEFLHIIGDIKPDVILVSGDIFDRSVPPIEAINLLDDVLSKILMDYGIPMVMIAGNHDSPDRLAFGSKLMEGRGLNIIGKLMMNRQPMVIHDQYGPVYFHTIPYVEPSIVRYQLNEQNIHNHDGAMLKMIEHINNRMNKKYRNVLVAHAFVAGGEESESERPLCVGGSGVVNGSYFKEFNYVALGHLHRPQRVGGENIRYSGSLMKYSFDEVHQKKGVTFIDMNEKGLITVEDIPLNPRRDVRCIEGYLKDLLEGSEKDDHKEDYIMVTLKDEGALLDPMGKLRRIYPNVLHIERSQLAVGGNLVGAHRNFRKIKEVDLFSSFFNQVTEKPIRDEEKRVFEEMLEKYYKSIREG